MPHDHHDIDPTQHAALLTACGLAPYLLGDDPSGLLVAVAGDDRYSAWPSDPATASPRDLAASVIAAHRGHRPWSRVLLLTYDAAPRYLADETLAVFAAAGQPITAAWHVDTAAALVYPCGGCDRAHPHPPAPTVTDVLSDEDERWSPPGRRALRARLDPENDQHPIPAAPLGTAKTSGTLLRRILLDDAAPGRDELAWLAGVLHLPRTRARAEAMAHSQTVALDRWIDLVRRLPAWARGNAASLLADAAAGAPRPDPFLIIDAVAIAVRQAANDVELNTALRQAAALRLPPVKRSPS